MEKYLYLSLTPEALIASMLPPEEFGTYFAVGTKKRTRGQAIFFEIDREKVNSYFPLDLIDKRCVPNENGKPKRSVYLSIYRVLEHIPLDAFKSLYLATDDGRVLELSKGEYEKKSNDKLHLYQQLCPVTPLIASIASPREFIEILTDKERPVWVPKIVFVELELGELANNPETGSLKNLPYPNIHHLRDCLISLSHNPDKPSKTVIRTFRGELFYRMCKNGFFVGDADKFLFYPFPSLEELNERHHVWWRSALNIGFS